VEERLQRRQEGPSDDLGAFGSGVNAVLLDGAWLVNQIFVDHGHEGHVVAGREGAEYLVERLDVVRAVVWGQRDAGQQDTDVRGFKRSENLVKVVAGLIEGQAAQAVVTAKLDDDHLRMKAQDGGKDRDGVLGGGSAGASIDDLIVVSLGVELPLQGVGEGLATRKSMARGDAVAEADQNVRVDLRSGSRKRECRDQQAD